MLHLEKLSYYQHLSLSGGQERPICACRVVDIRGSRFHVLSRIQDSGLDFTGRTNFIAHHLVLAPEELRPSATPPVILRDWPGWVKSWTKEPQLLEQEDWSSLAALAGRTCVPAQTWQRVTGDPVNGYGLLEARAGASFRVDDQPDETVLGLFAESLELLEVRDPRRDFRAAAWKYTFTTSMQEQDNPADFRWRCIHSDNPAANRFATPDCRALSAVRATKCTGEETAFACAGRQPPRFVAEPLDMQITEGEAARFQARAEGVPNPGYQWFSVDRAGNGQTLAGENGLELVIANPPLGLSRYMVRAGNSAGDITSKVATLSVEQKIRLQQTRAATGPHNPAETAAAHQKSAEDIESQRHRLQAEQAQEQFHKRLRRNKILVTILTIVVVAVASVFGWNKLASKKSFETLPLASIQKTQETNNLSKEQAESGSNSPANTNRADGTKIDSDESNHNRNIPANLPPETTYPLPPEWTPMVIGKVANATAEFPPRKFVLSAAAEGFAANGDNVFFVCKPNDGTEFIATIPKVNSDSAARRGGIMIRESRETNSPFLFIGASFERIFVYRRDGKREFFPSGCEIPNMKRDQTLYLRFDLQGNSFTPAYSFDSKVDFRAWTFFTNFAISATQQMLIGFALSSGNLSNRVTAQFVDMSPRLKTTKKN